MKQKDVISFLRKLGYVKTKNQPFNNAILLVSSKKGQVPKRAILSRKLVRLEARHWYTDEWVCYSRSFYGQIVTGKEFMRIGSTVFELKPA